MKVGILAVQGSFYEHVKALEGLAKEVRMIRHVEDFSRIQALLIPGGESTTIGDFLGKQGLSEIIKKELPIFGTCAGMILLAKKISGGQKKGQSLLKMMDIEVERNAYGRQTESFEADLKLSWDQNPFQGIFIRAPKITKRAADVKVLAWHGDDPVLVRQGNKLACAFHPELADDNRIHRYFIEKVVKNEL